MKNFLIIGGAGFVGSHLAEELIRKGDSGNLIKKISELLSDTKKAKNVGSEGRKFVYDNFSWDVIAKKFSTDIKQLMNKK